MSSIIIKIVIIVTAIYTIALAGCVTDKSGELDKADTWLKMLNELPEPSYKNSKPQLLKEIDFVIEGKRPKFDQVMVLPNSFSRPVDCQTLKKSLLKEQCLATKNYLRERQALALLQKPLKNLEQGIRPDEIVFIYGQETSLLEKVEIVVDQQLVQLLNYYDLFSPESFTLTDSYAETRETTVSANNATELLKAKENGIDNFLQKITKQRVAVSRNDNSLMARAQIKTSADILSLKDLGNNQYLAKGSSYRRYHDLALSNNLFIDDTVLNLFPAIENTKSEIRFSLQSDGEKTIYRPQTTHPLATVLANPYEEKEGSQRKLDVLGNRLVLRDGKEIVSEKIVVRKAKELPLDRFFKENGLTPESAQ